MIVGIGCDILDISRVKRQLGADDGFTAQIFTSEEIAYCRGKRYPERHFAARFAAKEAFFKAVSDGARVDISWHDVEVTNEASGKPVITLSGKAAELAGKLVLQDKIDLMYVSNTPATVSPTAATTSHVSPMVFPSPVTWITSPGSRLMIASPAAGSR